MRKLSNQSNSWIVLPVLTLAMAWNFAQGGGVPAPSDRSLPGMANSIASAPTLPLIDEDLRIATCPTLPPPVDEDLRIATGPTLPPPVDEDLRIATGPTLPPPVDEDLRIAA
jgi:hypothetical protein